MTRARALLLLVLAAALATGCKKDDDCNVWYVACQDGREEILCAEDERNCSTTRSCPSGQICLLGLKSAALKSPLEGRCFEKGSYTCGCVDCSGSHYTVLWPDAGVPDSGPQPDVAALPDKAALPEAASPPDSSAADASGAQ